MTEGRADGRTDEQGNNNIPELSLESPGIKTVSKNRIVYRVAMYTNILITNIIFNT